MPGGQETKSERQIDERVSTHLLGDLPPALERVISLQVEVSNFCDRSVINPRACMFVQATCAGFSSCYLKSKIAECTHLGL